MASCAAVGQPDREALGAQQTAELQLRLREPAGAGGDVGQWQADKPRRVPLRQP
jgi:hypothetical protein